MPDRMTLAQSLSALKAVRGDDEIVITLMGTAREWMKLGSHPLDFVLVPSSMGQGTSLGLGMALAQPERNVIVCNGDGSMLMNLGSLVTLTAQGPVNLTVLVFDNGLYEVTGGQLTPASSGIRRDGCDLDFVAVARAAGFESVYKFDDWTAWQRDVRSVIDATGPTFACIKVTPAPEAGAPRPPGPGSARAAAFRETLASRSAEL